MGRLAEDSAPAPPPAPTRKEADVALGLEVPRSTVERLARRGLAFGPEEEAAGRKHPGLPDLASMPRASSLKNPSHHKRKCDRRF